MTQLRDRSVSRMSRAPKRAALTASRSRVQMPLLDGLPRFPPPSFSRPLSPPAAADLFLLVFVGGQAGFASPRSASEIHPRGRWALTGPPHSHRQRLQAGIALALAQQLFPAHLSTRPCPPATHAHPPAGHPCRRPRRQGPGFNSPRRRRRRHHLPEGCRRRNAHLARCGAERGVRPVPARAAAPRPRRPALPASTFSIHRADKYTTARPCRVDLAGAARWTWPSTTRGGGRGVVQLGEQRRERGGGGRRWRAARLGAGALDERRPVLAAAAAAGARHLQPARHRCRSGLGQAVRRRAECAAAPCRARGPTLRGGPAARRAPLARALLMPPP